MKIYINIKKNIAAVLSFIVNLAQGTRQSLSVAILAEFAIVIVVFSSATIAIIITRYLNDVDLYI